MNRHISRRRAILLIVVAGALITSYLLLSLPIIQVQKIQMDSPLPQNFYQTPLVGALALGSTNSTGNVNLSLENFTFSSSDNSTKASGSSGTLQATITPEGANSRIDLNVQMNGVHLKTSTFSGSFSSLTLSGYLIVDPTTNRLIISLTASTSALDIIRAFLGV